MSQFFDPKDPAEKVVLTFDLSSGLATGETLSGTLTTSVVCSLGTDASPGAVQNGVAALDVSAKLVLVPVQGGIDGNNYTIKVISNTSNAQKVLALSAILPVRA